MTAEELHFRRRFILPDLALTVIELLVVAGPLYAFLELDAAQLRVLWQVGPMVALVAAVIWWSARRWWILPVRRFGRRLASGAPADELAPAAYHALLNLPRRALALRVALWIVGVATVALSLRERAGFSQSAVLTAVMVAGAHSFGVNIFRAVWYERLTRPARTTLAPNLDALRRFADGWQEQLVLSALATGALGVAAIATFTYYFIPINLEQYLRITTWFPFTIIALSLGWYLLFRRLVRPIRGYLDEGGSPLGAYRAAQTLAYKLAAAKLGFWIVGELLLFVQGFLFFSIDMENAALMCGEAMVVTIGAALYEALWHRATLRPLLIHIAARHRPPPDTVRTPLSLRWKMLAGFGALTLFACGLSLFWSFMQFKTLATAFIQQESELRLGATLTELKQRASHGPLGEDEILRVLKATAAQSVPRHSIRDEAALYYLPPGADLHAIGVGGGKKGAPPLPWTGEALMRRLDRGQMELSGQHLTGAYARLLVGKVDYGSIAFLLPGYRGRGPSTVPQLKVLLFFFVALLVTSMGAVILVATDLTRPIRELQRHADAMARGDLQRPVVSVAGEADEVGRLTFAFEEMRRALNDKLRTSVEMNALLEEEVTRRTAELERRNRELNDALDRLNHAKDELVRAEKMASMGRLVAGIAHEINNPVNAVVNTVGPLDEVLGQLASGVDLTDAREMMRVIQRGAHRTKEIVQALHNYSRGDEDRVVDVDLHRGIDDSLDLLRHHLKHGIRIERAYGEVGRVRGHAGQLHQVFMNLITNAAQALGEDGRGGNIRISTATADGKAVIEVTDDGPGIPPDVLPRIFDPFFTTKEVGKGSGLGLSIVHGIVERHGGTIRVESEPGRGTTFTVSLPSGESA